MKWMSYGGAEWDDGMTISPSSKDYESCGWQGAIAQVGRRHYLEFSKALVAAAEGAQQRDDMRPSAALLVLGALTSLYLVPPSGRTGTKAAIQMIAMQPSRTSCRCPCARNSAPTRRIALLSVRSWRRQDSAHEIRQRREAAASSVRRTGRRVNVEQTQKNRHSPGICR